MIMMKMIGQFWSVGHFQAGHADREKTNVLSFWQKVLMVAEAVLRSSRMLFHRGGDDCAILHFGGFSKKQRLRAELQSSLYSVSSVYSY